MSWAAHDLEPYLLRRHLGAKISVVFCLAGSYSPDILTKWAVYGLDFSGNAKLTDDPVQLHRGWPGVGFTHSLLFGIALALLVYLLSKNWVWAFSFLIGAWAHVLSDTLDSVGVMLFWPITDWHLHLDAWQYVGQAGRQLDAIAYYTSFGGVWDVAWAIWLAFNWRMLTARYFWDEIAPKDSFWDWLGRKTRHNGTVMLTVYRASAFFGVASIVGWYFWSLVVNDIHASLSWVWGGPSWAPRQGPP